jgi:tRNA A58 N-methylase Trm61
VQFFPWYNKPLIAFLEVFLHSEMKVFEYGAGNSTLYYSQKVEKVFSIETRKEWLDFVLTNKTKENIEIKLCNNLKFFSNEIENFFEKKFDVIVVDSRDRAKCLATSISFLKNNGIIILDNSERKNLELPRQNMRDLGFEEKIFYGEREGGDFSTSSIFSLNSIKI